jgi:hypothetical protein
MSETGVEVLTEGDTSSCKVGLVVARSDNDKKQKSSPAVVVCLSKWRHSSSSRRPNDGKWRCTFTGPTERNWAGNLRCPCAVIARRASDAVQ